MARKGTFGSKLTPFGSGGALSDLSVYQIGTAPAAAPVPLTPTPLPEPTYSAADPPPRPTVAPETGVLPQPVLPQPTLPAIYLNPNTYDAREAIRKRSLAAGKTPTTATINATYAANKERLIAELLPEPVAPAPTTLSTYLDPDTAAAREAIRQRALAAGKTPTTAQINATYAANKARLLAAGG